MREIKFKAWNRKLRVFETEFMIAPDGAILTWQEIAPTSFDSIQTVYSWLPNDDLHLLRCTGQKDAEGTDIYEGDVLHCLESKTSEFDSTVIFKDGGFYLQQPWQKSHLNSQLMACDHLMQYYKIVGAAYI